MPMTHPAKHSFCKAELPAEGAHGRKAGAVRMRLECERATIRKTLIERRALSAVSETLSRRCCEPHLKLSPPGCWSGERD